VRGCWLTSQLIVGGTQVSERSAREKVRSRLSWWSEPRLNRSVARRLESLRNLLLGRGELKARLSLTLRSTDCSAGVRTDGGGGTPIVTRCRRSSRYCAGWLPSASASRTAASETPAAASRTRPDEPESEKMRQLCPEPVSASKPPISLRPGSASQV
jgi:hypothetical protein